jgi:hypothetical protein
MSPAVALCSWTIDDGASRCLLARNHSGGHQMAATTGGLAAALGKAKPRYDRVQAAYDGMEPADQATFREVINDEGYSHAQVAEALREIGYDVDRKQVHQFREKLALGKVTL